jgi:hypothetical protein
MAPRATREIIDRNPPDLAELVGWTDGDTTEPSVGNTARRMTHLSPWA